MPKHYSVNKVGSDFLVRSSGVSLGDTGLHTSTTQTDFNMYFYYNVNPSTSEVTVEGTLGLNLNPTGGYNPTSVKASYYTEVESREGQPLNFVPGIVTASGITRITFGRETLNYEGDIIRIQHFSVYSPIFSDANVEADSTTDTDPITFVINSGVLEILMPRNATYDHLTTQVLTFSGANATYSALGIATGGGSFSLPAFDRQGTVINGNVSAFTPPSTPTPTPSTSIPLTPTPTPTLSVTPTPSQQTAAFGIYGATSNGETILVGSQNSFDGAEWWYSWQSILSAATTTVANGQYNIVNGGRLFPIGNLEANHASSLGTIFSPGPYWFKPIVSGANGVYIMPPTTGKRKVALLGAGINDGGTINYTYSYKNTSTSQYYTTGGSVTMDDWCAASPSNTVAVFMTRRNNWIGGFQTLNTRIYIYELDQIPVGHELVSVYFYNNTDGDKCRIVSMAFE